LYEILAIVLQDRYPEVVEIQMVTAMAQGAFDVVDGAVWAGTRAEAPIFAIQISIGDPVMPNVGSEMVATAMNAVHLGVPIVDIPGLERGDVAVGRSAVTQFQAPGTSANDIHGFTARNTDAARAAQRRGLRTPARSAVRRCSAWRGRLPPHFPSWCLRSPRSAP
jgi:hypothetical protein